MIPTELSRQLSVVYVPIHVARRAARTRTSVHVVVATSTTQCESLALCDMSPIIHIVDSTRTRSGRAAHLVRAVVHRKLCGAPLPLLRRPSGLWPCCYRLPCLNTVRQTSSPPLWPCKRTNFRCRHAGCSGLVDRPVGGCGSTLFYSPTPSPAEPEAPVTCSVRLCCAFLCACNAVGRVVCLEHPMGTTPCVVSSFVLVSEEYVHMACHMWANKAHHKGPSGTGCFNQSNVAWILFFCPHAQRTCKSLRGGLVSARAPPTTCAAGDACVCIVRAKHVHGR